MKDNKQNLTDLIGALAVDIEEVKKKLDAKDSSDKNEALKRLEAKLEPVIRFFNGNAPENVNAIFGSKEAIEEYKQSIGDEAIDLFFAAGNGRKLPQSKPDGFDERTPTLSGSLRSPAVPLSGFAIFPRPGEVFLNEGGYGSTVKFPVLPKALSLGELAPKVTERARTLTEENYSSSVCSVCSNRIGGGSASSRCCSARFCASCKSWAACTLARNSSKYIAL